MTSSSVESNKRNIAGTVFRIVVTLLCGAVLFSSIEVEEVLSAISRLSWAWLGLALVMCWVQTAIGASRWWVLATLSVPTLTLPGAWRYHTIGAMFNQVLPSTVGGDAVRLTLMSQEGHRVAEAIQSVVLDRVFALIGLGMLVVATQPLARGPELAGISALLVAAGVGAVFALGKASGFLAPRFQGRVQELLRSTSELVQSPKHVVAALIISMFNFAFMSLTIWTMSIGMGVDLGFVDAQAMMAPVWLAMALPISVGGWGVREGAAVGALALVGIDESAALGLSISYGLLNAVGVVTQGVPLWLYRPTRD